MNGGSLAVRLLWLTLLTATFAGMAQIRPLRAAPRYAALMEAVPKDAPQEAANELTKKLYDELNASGEYSLVVREWVVSHQNARIGRGCLTVSCAVRLGEGLGVEWVLTAALTREGGNTWNTTLSLINVPDKKMVQVETVRFKGSVDEAVRRNPGKLVTAFKGGAPEAETPVASEKGRDLPPLASAKLPPVPPPSLTAPGSETPPVEVATTEPSLTPSLAPSPGTSSELAPVVAERPKAQGVRGAFPRLVLSPLTYTVFRADALSNSAPGLWDGQWEEIRGHGVIVGYQTVLMTSEDHSAALLGDARLELGKADTIVMPDAVGNQLREGGAGGSYQILSAGFHYNRQFSPYEFGVGFSGFSGALNFSAKDFLFGGGGQRSRGYEFTGMRFTVDGAYHINFGWSVGGLLQYSDVARLKGSRVNDYTANGAPAPHMYNLTLGVALNWRY